MPQIVNNNSKLIRINTAKNTIEYSQNGGHSWMTCCNSASYGTFIDLLYHANELFACTSKGLYVSINNGFSFSIRCNNASSHGEFRSIQAYGNELLASTTKGLYYSTNRGFAWIRK